MLRRFAQWRHKSPPSRPLLGLFLAAIVLPALALGWLGWRLFDQDRALEQQRVQERIELAADLVSAALLNELSTTDERLAALGRATDAPRVALTFGQADAALFAVVTSDTVWISRAKALLYDPALPDPSEPAATAMAFAGGQDLEFIKKDLAGAFGAYRRLTQSNSPTIRAGAEMRVARVLRKLRRPDAALRTYDELARFGSTPVAGLPAELVARHGRCTVLHDLGRRADLEREAAALDELLQNGRWRLTRAQYRFYSGEAAAWLGAERRADSERQAHQRQARALSAGVQSMWDEMQNVGPDDVDVTRRRTLLTDDAFVVLQWRRTSDRLVALVAAPAYAERLWFRELGPLADRQGVRLLLTAENGQTLAGTADLIGPQARRVAADTHLPWTLSVATADPVGEASAVAGRRRLLLMGLAAVVLLVVSGSYVIARGISRELAVARVQSDFVAAVSHEFRTPLASVRQLSELLDDGRVPDEQRRGEYYRVLRHESGRLQRLVEGLLDFGRMEAGAKEYRFEQLDPGSLVRSVADEFAQEAAANAHRIEVDVNGHLPPVRADCEALGRAVWNLLDNAVKYAPLGKTIRVEATAADGRVAIRVRDEGLGIAPDERDQIFAKFTRGASARVSGAKGTGLGLAMVRHIVHAHGGEIRLESELGRGSTFSIVLPAEKRLANVD